MICLLSSLTPQLPFLSICQSHNTISNPTMTPIQTLTSQCTWHMYGNRWMDGQMEGWTDGRMDRTDKNCIPLRHTNRHISYAGGIIRCSSKVYYSTCSTGGLGVVVKVYYSTCLPGTSIQPLPSVTSLHSIAYGEELTSMKYGVIVTIFVRPECERTMLMPTYKTTNSMYTV